MDNWLVHNVFVYQLDCIIFFSCLHQIVYVWDAFHVGMFQLVQADRLAFQHVFSKYCSAICSMVLGARPLLVKYCDFPWLWESHPPHFYMISFAAFVVVVAAGIVGFSLFLGVSPCSTYIFLFDWCCHVSFACTFFMVLRGLRLLVRHVACSKQSINK